MVYAMRWRPQGHRACAAHEIPELAAERLAAFFTDAETAAAVAPERERVNLGEA